MPAGGRFWLLGATEPPQPGGRGFLAPVPGESGNVAPALDLDAPAGLQQVGAAPRARPAARLLLPRLGAALFGLVLAVVVAELTLRLAPPAQAAVRLPLSYDVDAIDRIAAGEAYVSFDPELGWVPTPGADLRGGTTRYAHNQAGLRALREYSPQPAPGWRRFSAYGDSFTYCMEVSIGNCWTEKLAAALPQTEVLNYGVPGYAPDQAWLRYQRGGAQARPCAVLIGHMVENINRVVNRFRPFYEPTTGIPLGKPRFLWQGDHLQLLPTGAHTPADFRDPAWVERQLGPHDLWYFPGTFVANPFDWLATVRLGRTALYERGRRDGVEWTPAWAERMYRPDSEPFAVLLGVLSAFADQVRADGATPVVLVFPMRDEVEAARDGRPKTHQPLLDALQARGIPVIDLTDTLGRQARRVDMSKLFDGHYTPFANEKVAETLAERLPALTAATCDGSVAR